MKKYFVSLALKVYSNFETEVEAKSEKEALNLALEKYESGDYDQNDIAEPDWDNAELDVDCDKNGKISPASNGAHIEEVD
jgi:hypothetical protein